MKKMKKYTIIDSHCHIFPDKVAQKATDSTELFYGITKSPFDGTVSMLLNQCDENGIDRCVIHSVATKPHQVSGINRFIAEQVQKHPGRFIGLGTLHPESDDIKADFDELCSLGLRGVKLHPDIQGFKLDDYRCLKMYELCEQKKLPVLIHTGDKRYDFSNPNRLKPILNIYTGLTVIGAHFGGWSIWEKALGELKGIPNLYVDCSSSFYALTDEQIVKLIRGYGADRVLFGTDYPMWKQADELKRLFSLGLAEEELTQILGTNAVKIFG